MCESNGLSTMKYLLLEKMIDVAGFVKQGNMRGRMGMTCMNAILAYYIFLGEKDYHT